MYYKLDGSLTELYCRFISLFRDTYEIKWLRVNCGFASLSTVGNLHLYVSELLPFLNAPCCLVVCGIDR